MFGKDLNKIDKPIIPEALGLVAGTVYLNALFLFIPFRFVASLHSMAIAQGSVSRYSRSQPF